MTRIKSNFERSPNENYQTEPYGTEVLLRHLPRIRGRRIWECAAGNHAIADVLRRAGADVITSDIATYDRSHDATFDFVNGDAGPPHLVRREIDDIITNPPYGPNNRLAVKFCERALELCDGWVAMLLTEGFDSGKSRTHLFRDSRRFAMKISFLDRLRWFPGTTTEGTSDHAWYVWAPETSLDLRPRMFWEGR